MDKDDITNRAFIERELTSCRRTRLQIMSKKEDLQMLKEETILTRDISLGEIDLQMKELDEYLENVESGIEMWEDELSRREGVANG